MTSQSYLESATRLFVLVAATVAVILALPSAVVGQCETAFIEASDGVPLP